MEDGARSINETQIMKSKIKHSNWLNYIFFYFLMILDLILLSQINIQQFRDVEKRTACEIRDTWVPIQVLLFIANDFGKTAF